MVLHLMRKTRRIRNIEQCISVKEYAQKYSLTTRGVIARIHSGKLVGYKINGRWYVNAVSFCY